MSNGRCWSSEEIGKLKRLVAAGWTDAQIGGDLRRNCEVVRRKRTEMNLKPGQSPAMTVALRRLRARERARCHS